MMQGMEHHAPPPAEDGQRVRGWTLESPPLHPGPPPLDLDSAVRFDLGFPQGVRFDLTLAFEGYEVRLELRHAVRLDPGFLFSSIRELARPTCRLRTWANRSRGRARVCASQRKSAVQVG